MTSIILEAENLKIHIGNRDLDPSRARTWANPQRSQSNATPTRDHVPPSHLCTAPLCAPPKPRRRRHSATAGGCWGASEADASTWCLPRHSHRRLCVICEEGGRLT